jgi:Ca-activated chloride channel family protein
MGFLWPQALWLLVVMPLLMGLYVLLLRRRKKAVLRFASLGVIREAAAGSRGWRRHVPPLLFLVALTVLIVAIARPTAVITLPSEQRTIILALDVSLSMRATDVQPSRLAAAREAAKTFVAEQPDDVRIGVVAFAGSASLVQSPTRERKDLVAAIDQLQLQRHTAIGSGIIVSLATIFPDERDVLDPARYGGRSPYGAAARSLDEPPKEKKEAKEFKPVPAGSNRSAAIILLTDGRRTTGPDPMESAKLAAERGVKVYTVGFGTQAGAMADIDGMSIFMRFDEESLKAIAAATAAEYFHAASAAELKKVYETLNARYVLERKDTEVAALLSGLAAVLAVAAAAMSLLWFNRIA